MTAALPPLPIPARKQGEQMSFAGKDTVFFDCYDNLQMHAYALAAIAAQAQPVQPTPPGWKLVPIEPTCAMVSAGYRHNLREIEDDDDSDGSNEFYRLRGQAIAVYSDMLAASPAHGIGAPAIDQTLKDAA